MSFELLCDIVFSLLLVLNVAGNSLVIYVVCKKQRNSADYLLLNLALSDMLFGILIVPKIFKYTIKGIDKDIVKNRWMCTLFMRGMLPYTAMLSSISTMMILTLERHFAICRPHSFKKWFSTEKVKMSIVVSWIMGIIFHIPYSIEVECIADKDKAVTQFYSLLQMVFAVLELVFLIILSTKIYLSLWHKQTVIHPSAHREIEERKRKKKITLCVLTVVGSFVFCYIPYFTLTVLARYDLIKDAKIFGMPAKKLTDLFLVLNAAVDPYLYTCQNTRLRALLRKLMLCGTGTTDREQERPCTT